MPETNEKHKLKHIGLRLDEDTLEKIRYIAAYNGRSICGHVLYLARTDIRRFEREVEMIERLGEEK